MGDIVEGVVRSIDRPYDYQFINLVQKHVGKEAIIKVLPDQPGDVPYTCADVAKAKYLLGYQSTVAFEDGIKRTVDWYINKYARNRDTTTDAVQETIKILPSQPIAT